MLETPLTIRNITLTNRIVMPPMASGKSTDEGLVSNELITYYKDRALAGTGLIMTEHAFIAPSGKASANQLSVSKDEDIAGLKRLADEIHQNTDSAVIVQINHAGSAARQDDPEAENIAPSSVLRPGREGSLPRTMSEDEIREVIGQFAEAAERVIRAGFDGVEIHSAHGYLLNQFYSPLTNQRTDAWGGSLENRIRIHCEVLRAVRQRIGEDHVISLRLGGCDYLEGGSTVEDAVKASVILEKAGADMISVSGGMRGYVNPADSRPGYFRDMSTPIREAVTVPVLLCGGITEAEDAEALLQQNCADLIGIGRAMLKDAGWSRSALAESGR